MLPELDTKADRGLRNLRILGKCYQRECAKKFPNWLKTTLRTELSAYIIREQHHLLVNSILLILCRVRLTVNVPIKLRHSISQHGDDLITNPLQPSRKLLAIHARNDRRYSYGRQRAMQFQQYDDHAVPGETQFDRRDTGQRWSL